MEQKGKEEGEKDTYDVAAALGELPAVLLVVVPQKISRTVSNTNSTDETIARQSLHSEDADCRAKAPLTC